MGVVNDPQAIKFCNERLRPLAEEIERLFAELQSVKGWWDVYGGTFFGGRCRARTGSTTGARPRACPS